MTQTIITNTYVQGTTIILTTEQPFTAVDGVTAVDPDRVMIGFQIGGDPTKIYTFDYNHGVGDLTGTIVRTGLGSYQANIDTSLYSAGVWVYSIACEPIASIAHDTTKTKVRVEGQLIVVPASFPMV